ncbi:inositol monophosphatase family protein [soil metagenome]
MDEIMQNVQTVVREAGSIALRHFENSADNSISIKPDGSPVSAADMEVDAYIEATLHKQYPHISYLSEEDVRDIHTGLQWVVDPIDGTANFITGNPLFGISIALLNDKQPILGVIYSPTSDEMYTAIRGRGALKNGVPISTSSDTELVEAIILVDNGTHERTVRFNGGLRQTLSTRKALPQSRKCASRELCAVADGSASGMIHRALNVWDIAAGVLLVEESGGVVTDLQGNPKDIFTSGIVAGSPAIARELSSITKVALDREGMTP